MNASQLILSFASIIILSTIIVLTNRASLETQDERISARNLYHSINEARNLFEEIKSKMFDEKLISMNSFNRDSLTPNSMLGPDNETHQEFDDIDDYNGFVKEIGLENGKKFLFKVQVTYVNENNPDFLSTTRTFYKLVTIKCTDQNQSQRFELKQIFSIW